MPDSSFHDPSGDPPSVADARVPPVAENTAAPPSRWKTILRSTFVRLVGGFLFVAITASLAIAAVNGSVIALLGRQFFNTRLCLGNLAGIGGALLAYLLYVRWTEGRRYPAELSLRHAAREGAGGTALGAGMFSLTMLLLWLAGAYRLTGSGAYGWNVLLPSLFGSLAAAFMEEILFRGLLFRLCEQGLGTRWALFISAAFFGVVHLLNPHANWWAGLAIALEAGVFLAAAYVATRRLWLPIGAHFGWNFTEGGLFGTAVSGHQGAGYFQGELSGPDWLSGGGFGAEASVLAIAVCVGVASLLLWRARRMETLADGRLR